MAGILVAPKPRSGAEGESQKEMEDHMDQAQQQMEEVRQKRKEFSRRRNPNWRKVREQAQVGIEGGQQKSFSQ